MNEAADPNPDHLSVPSARHLDTEMVSASWASEFERALPGLRAFLGKRLRQASDVEDCLQVVSMRMIEQGSRVAPAARRAWLFRVAANESARMWRASAAAEKLLEGYQPPATPADDPSDQTMVEETSRRVIEALHRLPPAWQQVVRLRIFEDLTFQQIADRLEIPLGTALTQMRRALERVREELDTD